MQLDGPPGDHHAVRLIGLMRRVILLLAGDMGHQRLDTYQRQAPLPHNRCTCSHRGPVGSHATVTAPNPFARACPRPSPAPRPAGTP